MITGEKLTGTINATSYLEISRPSVPTDFGNNLVFDSLVIEMRFNGFYMGDTLNNQMHLLVHQLSERIEQDVDVGTETYYNTTSFAYEPVPLAEATFPICPADTGYGKYLDGGILIEPVRIRLPDNLGQELFDKMKNHDDEFDTSEKFLDYFKGLALVAGDDVKTIAGFKADTSFKINLHYHLQEEFKTEKVISFSINTVNQFNNIVSDRTGTDLLPESFVENEIDSHLTGNQSFISAGDGLYTKIEFPYIQSILLLSDYGIVERAVLEVKPVYGTYGNLTISAGTPLNYTPLPLALTISATTLSGEAESALTDSQGQSQTGSLLIDQQFWENTGYIFDVTSFIQNQMSAPANQQLYLTLRFANSEMQKTTQRLVIGNSDHQINVGNRTYYNRIKLKLYYNMYNEKN
jgi:hypothetical protein